MPAHLSLTPPKNFYQIRMQNKKEIFPPDLDPSFWRRARARPHLQQILSSQIRGQRFFWTEILGPQKRAAMALCQWMCPRARPATGVANVWVIRSGGGGWGLMAGVQCSSCPLGPAHPMCPGFERMGLRRQMGDSYAQMERRRDMASGEESSQQTAHNIEDDDIDRSVLCRR